MDPSVGQVDVSPLQGVQLAGAHPRISQRVDLGVPLGVDLVDGLEHLGELATGEGVTLPALGDLCARRPDAPGGVGQVVLGGGVLEELLGHPPPPEHGLVRVGLTVGPRPLRR